MCNIKQLSSKVYQFDGFSFCNSFEQPNYWCLHNHEEIQITLPQTNAKAWINYQSSINSRFVQQIKAGEAFLVSPNQSHALDWQSKAELTVFYLHPRFFARAIGKSTDKNCLEFKDCFRLVDDFIIREIGFIFRNLCTLGLANEKLYIENLANLLAVHLLKNYLTCDFKIPNSCPRLSNKVICRIIEYIEANLSQKITLSDLAGVANLGKFYFSHSFKSSTNMTPYSYVLQQRVKRAKKLLQSSDMSICDIALECGFGNQSHLSKHFRKKLGITPMDYRKSTH